MIRVAAYCRVSTDKKDQANSFEAQQRYFREHIDRNPDFELYAIYADEGITGTSTAKRTQFNRMISDAYAGRFTLILTKEISRFSRNILDTITYTRDLKRIGVGVHFLTENLNTRNPESEMLLTFMGVLAQEESRRTSVRVKWGQTRQMEQGVVFGHSLLGYDVHNGQLTINEEEAELVRMIYHKYTVEQKGTSVIARELRQAGYRTKTGNPNWNVSHIIKILRNEKYAGDLIQKKSYTPDYLTHAKKANRGEEELIVLRDHHDPIIPREIWDETQAELSKRSKHTGEGHSNRYLFSGKITCGECGATFLGRQKRRSDGRILRRWSCGTVVTQGAECCNVGKLVRDDDAHDMLKTALQSLQLDQHSITDQVVRIVRDVSRTEERGIAEDPQHLQRQLDTARRKKDACLDSYFAGDITREEMLSAKDKYDNQIAELEQRIAAPAESSALTERAVRKAVTDLLNGTTESDAFYRCILENLTVFRDRHLELRLKALPQNYHFR